MSGQGNTIRLVLNTGLALLAFAANSVICRAALEAGTIDASSFTTIRVVSGAVVLWLVLHLKGEAVSSPGKSSWWPAIFLFGYMIFFSFAYNLLEAGTGALILFGSVQITMLVIGLMGGERFSGIGWIGFAVAVAGLAYLLLPGASAPPPWGAALMAIAGVAWGGYSIAGKSARNAIRATSVNFSRCVPLAIVASLFFLPDLQIDAKGIWLAILSGAVSSGLGYVVWYAVLPSLASTQAATIQLSVPVIAAFGGVLLLGEDLTQRLIIAALLIIGGIATVIRTGRAVQ